MWTVNMITLNDRNGYYVEKRYGCNITRQWCKTKKKAMELAAKWREECHIEE